MKPRQKPQRGGIALLMVSLITALAALMAWQAQALLQTELQTVDDQQKAVRAHQRARAALDWSVAQLNTPWRHGANCQRDDAALNRFAQTYAPSNAAATIPCQTTAQGLNCQCTPGAANNANNNTSGDDTSITLSLQATANTSANTPANTTDGWTITATSGSQSVRASARFHPALNANTNTNTNASAVFSLPPSQWPLLPQVKRLDCGPGAACDAALAEALAAGWRWFHLPQGFSLVQTGQTIGSANAPVLLVIEGPLQLPAATTVHGALVHNGQLLSHSGFNPAEWAQRVRNIGWVAINPSTWSTPP